MSDLWSYSAGEKPHTVRVFERKPGGPLFARAWDARKRNWRLKSLSHRNKQQAKRYAVDQAAKLQAGRAQLAESRITVARVFALYEQHRTPRKTLTEQRQDGRRFELWGRVLGGNSDPHDVSLEQWEAFVDARLSGRIDARGNAAKKPKRVRARAVESDCLWLRWVFNWAVEWRHNGRYLMRENPVRGFDAPRELNPKRPVASEDRYEQVRAVSDRVMMEVPGTGKSKLQRSYLSELLDIANGSGRRISAVCALRYDDLRLDRTQAAPFGAIVWRAENDKERFESVVPMSPAMRAAVDRVLAERPGIGRAPLFPSPAEPSEPITRYLASKWFYKAERLAGLPRQSGSLWHAYRRKWATSRKHLPDADVMAAGGWRSAIAFKQSYQLSDSDTLLSVVLGATELRQAR